MPSVFLLKKSAEFIWDEDEALALLCPVGAEVEKSILGFRRAGD